MAGSGDGCDFHWNDFGKTRCSKSNEKSILKEGIIFSDFSELIFSWNNGYFIVFGSPEF